MSDLESSLPDGFLRAVCPGCGRGTAAPARFAGKTVKCKKCGEGITFPGPAGQELLLDFESPPPPRRAPLPAATAVRETPRPPVPTPAARASAPSWAPPADGLEPVRRGLRWGFVLLLLPLLLFTFSAQDDWTGRFERTVASVPGLDEQLDAVSSEDEVFALLPGKRIQGAFLAHDSRAHWFFALLTAGLFFGYIRFAYPLGEARPLELVWIALFTATIGILLLLAFQYVTAFTQGVWLRGGGIAAVFFYIVKFIGFSYRCALDPSNGFLASFFGFTMGVGLCEELCKTLPILWHFRKSASLDWRGAIVWGLMSGAGFGISEAGHYSSDFYNGIATGGIYLVRFLSCVALHAVWSGTAALIVWRRQHEVQEVDEWWEWIVAILRILWIVMILHGLYDTLLKREFGVLALLIAIASFGYFAWEFERARKFQEEANTAIAAATPAE